MLSTIIGYIVSAILSWVAAKLHTWFMARQAQQADDAKTDAAVAAQKAATTSSEIDDASKKISGDF